MEGKIQKSMKLLFAALALSFVFLFAGGVKAQADVRQTTQTQNSITVAWDAFSLSSGDVFQSYQVYAGEDYSQLALKVTIPAEGTRAYTIAGLQPGTEYCVKVVCNYTYDSIHYTSYEYEYLKTLPGKVTGVNQERWYHWIESVDFAWDKQTGVDGYEYIIKDSSNKTKANKTQYYNSGSQSIQNNQIYTLQVRSFATINGTKYYSDWSSNAYLFEQPYLTDTSKTKKNNYVSNGKLKVTWPKTKGATGYDIYVSTKAKSGYVKVKSVSGSKTTATISKFKKKKFSSSKKYYVYVVAKKKAGGKTYTSGKLYYWMIRGKSIAGQYYF